MKLLKVKMLIKRDRFVFKANKDYLCRFRRRIPLCNVEVLNEICHRASRRVALVAPVPLLPFIF